MSTGLLGRGAGARLAPHRLPLFLVVAVGVATAAALAATGAAAQEASWIFDRSTYSHDPATGARVGQYARVPPVEALDDQRLVTSRYRYSRTNLRGMDGSWDYDYQVQSWGNDLGGIDAQWERFHDAWMGSYLSGGYYAQPYTHYRPYGPWFYGGHPAALPGYGYGGYSGYRGPVYGWPAPGYGWPP
jgi:hypothetical protein